MAGKTINGSTIIHFWNEHQLSKHIESAFGKEAELNRRGMKCFKDSFKSSIWKLNLLTKKGPSSIILKVFKSYDREKNAVELNMYSKARKAFGDFMPEIYHAEYSKESKNVWVLMETIQSLESQVVYTPHHFDQIIPALAKMHARMHGHRFYEHRDVFAGWLPEYHSEEKIQRRNEIKELTLAYLEKAMNRPDLNAVLAPSYSQIQRIIRKGPHYFPELLEAGQSICHSDLQALNIGCNNIKDARWNVKFLDWEGARYDPCWFDLVSLVGVFLSYRDDWRKDETAIVARCARLYADEMRKYGIVFKQDPVTLYTMAEMQLILEKNLYLQLYWEVEGVKRGYLLRGYMEKINKAGKQMGL
ncbi:phosphotransferase [Paenibacillus gansuensis]|uniref:Phosphotransferase n=1 Tax=Paenibacillus gansuensis TaxID=306542 RepID=A0ABW5PAX3_9BACL